MPRSASTSPRGAFSPPPSAWRAAGSSFRPSRAGWRCRSGRPWTFAGPASAGWHRGFTPRHPACLRFRATSSAWRGGSPPVPRAHRDRRARLAAAASSLGHLDPSQVLSRGYAIVRAADGSVVRSGTALSRGDALDLTFAEGGAAVTVDAPR